MKVYLAGPSAEIDRVRAVASELEEAGHEIVDKWWSRVEAAGRPDDKLDDATLHASTTRCREAVARAEALVAIPGVLSLRLSTGAAVEVGMALVREVTVFLFGLVEGLPFRTHCTRVSTIDHLLAELRQLEHARAVAAMDEAGYRAGDEEPSAWSPDVCSACGVAWTAAVRGCLVCKPLRAHEGERAVQLVAGPPAPPEVVPALGGSDVAVEEPQASQGRRPDAREKLEILASMVRRAAREIRDRPVREALLVDLEREMAEG